MIDGPRVLAAAKEMGLDPQKVAASGNTEATLDLLRTTAKVGGDAGLAATPAYVIGGVAIVGHPGRKSLEKVIASMRQCKKVVC
jgi:protein-disulfide isomerase